MTCTPEDHTYASVFHHLVRKDTISFGVCKSTCVHDLAHNKRWQTAHYPLHGFHLYMYARCSQCCHHNRSTTLLAFILRTLNRLLKGYYTSCTRPTRQATEAVREPPQSYNSCGFQFDQQPTRHCYTISKEL